MILEALFAVAVSCAAAFDLRTRRIPNWLNLAILLGGLAAHAALGGLSALGASAGGAALGIAMLLLPFHVRWIGGGDVKLLGAIGAWLGPRWVLCAGIIALALGGLIAVAILIRGGPRLRSEVGQNLKLAYYTMSSPDAPQRPRHQRVPLAPPLALAAIGVLVYIGGLHV